MAITEYAYYYAIIDLNTGLCIGVQDTTDEANRPDYISIDVYNEEYCLKYYNQADGRWYWDASFTNEWIPE